MDTINNSGLDTDLYWQEETVKIADGTEQQLSQEDFFAMLTEQLANQDPTAPVDNDQMVAQMTSFTMADGISQLNDKFESFAASMTSNQALQASSLIGQNVLVQGNIGHMAAQGDGLSGVVVNEQTVQNMKINIENQYGEVIKTIDAGTQAAGNIAFEWDGKDTQGNDMPEGDYVITATGEVDGENTQLSTAVNRHVGSVSLAGSGQGVILNLAGDVSINLDDVIQIGS
ncbi:MAG TPA: flagellar hook assembly protein FlgD [Alteromonas australica]|uniref:Basal-body rod modification protein FlgD n=1 Tax=Alteromonas australica TaxID=589873 RepID=A0A075NX64_9ALTE|nr:MULTISPECIES: flagellar hook assembly protein FlgD [Alteromonas]MAB91858.1 flagellar hook assembly protein FlgD [Alteromonas sp.]AIF98106.1 flagellar basal body rod modification protein FlgD [Alteromonas australica]MAF69525.1 flagellar hook assembly protein FlgD [Alteromonas sp.]MAO29565.1 flagellar hook assembly protein FlgD [Alteromonas sp.]QPL49165.1 flagellar hook assembly protein FlgD [Alteromonas sp. B31-7]